MPTGTQLPTILHSTTSAGSSTTVLKTSTSMATDVQRGNTTYVDIRETDRNKTSFAPHDGENGYDLRVLICAVVGAACLVLAFILGVCWWRRKKFRFQGTFSVLYKRYFQSSISNVVNWDGTFRKTTPSSCTNERVASVSDGVKCAFASHADTSNSYARTGDVSNFVSIRPCENLGERTCTSCPYTEVLRSTVLDIGQASKSCLQSDRPLGSPTSLGYVSLYDLSSTQGLPVEELPYVSSGPYVLPLENPSDATGTSSPEIYSEVNYHANVNTLFHLDSQSTGFAGNNTLHHNCGIKIHKSPFVHMRVDEHVKGLTDPDTDAKRIRIRSCRHQKYAPKDPTTDFIKDITLYVNVKELQHGFVSEIDTRKTSKDLKVQFLNKALTNGKVKLKSDPVYSGDYVNHVSLHIDLTGPNGSTDTDV